ncbi:MAG: LysM peptidoglycan-binding domain-containing protein [Alphaproteobacteria bacterium]|nr:LysM peptidoglycan-binding domain-containing protein [Alphaproteobacteria bacterium]
MAEEKPEHQIHEIVWGDTLSELAVEYGTTVEVLAKLNDIQGPEYKIYAGKMLKLPELVKPEPEQTAAPEVAASSEQESVEPPVVETVEDLAAAKPPYDAIVSAIEQAKVPGKNPLENPAVAEPLGQLVQIIAQDYFDRDNRLSKTPNDTDQIGDWHKIDSVVKDGHLTMSLWQNGDATVATVLSIVDPLEGGGIFSQKHKSYGEAHDKIEAWHAEHPNLVLVGHGAKGSTIALIEAKAQNLPALALEPYPPKDVALSKDDPVVSFKMSDEPVLSKDSYSDGRSGVVRMIDGSNILGTGHEIATNFINKVDARSYYAAFSIARTLIDPHANVMLLNEPVQPWFIRLGNDPLGFMGSPLKPQDLRLEAVREVIKEERQKEKAVEPAPEVKPGDPSASLNTPDPETQYYRAAAMRDPVGSQFNGAAPDVNDEKPELIPQRIKDFDPGPMA